MSYSNGLQIDTGLGIRSERVYQMQRIPILSAMQQKEQNVKTNQNKNIKKTPQSE
jgi:hypothetical protein